MATIVYSNTYAERWPVVKQWSVVECLCPPAAYTHTSGCLWNAMSFPVASEKEIVSTVINWPNQHCHVCVQLLSLPFLFIKLTGSNRSILLSSAFFPFLWAILAVVANYKLHSLTNQSVKDIRLSRVQFADNCRCCVQLTVSRFCTQCITTPCKLCT